jgi:hypothetical protein
LQSILADSFIDASRDDTRAIASDVREANTTPLDSPASLATARQLRLTG